MEPRDLTIAQASQAIAGGKLSPPELMESLLEQIRELEPSLKAWVTLDEEAALRSARDAEAEISSGGPRTPLHGIPIGVKDIYYTKGVLTTAGAPQYRDFIPGYDATSVAKLKDAGAIILGKAVTTQFADGDPSPTFNPWHREHTPGGSSSGSAVAVAARMCPAALGSQTGGSTLRPAIYNGVVGLKPTYGRISRYGVVPFAWSLDTVGIIARTVNDTALLLQAMAGHDCQRRQLIPRTRRRLPERLGRTKRPAAHRRDTRVLLRKRQRRGMPPHRPGCAQAGGSGSRRLGN